MKYPVGLSILVAAKSEDGYRTETYTLLSTCDTYAADIEAVVGDLKKTRKDLNRRWPLEKPKYIGITDVFWVGASKPKKGVPFGMLHRLAGDVKAASAKVPDLGLTFPLWVISPYVLVQSYFYLPPENRKAESKICVVSSMAGKFKLKRGYPLASTIQRHLTSKDFLKLVALPRRYPPKLTPVLLDWTLVPTERAEGSFPRGVVCVEPWIHCSASRMEKEVMSKKQVAGRMADIADVWRGRG